MKQKLRSSQLLFCFLIGLFLQTFAFSDVFAKQLVAHQNDKSIKDIYVKVSVKNASLREMISLLEEKTGFVFSYDQKILERKVKFTFPEDVRSLEEILLEMSRKASIQFRRINNGIDIKDVPFGDGKGNVIETTQVFEVRGTVTVESSGEGIPGVNILVKGTSIGTVTDLEGRYSINVPSEKDTLIFSSIGFQAEEMPVNNRSVIDVALAEDIKGLDEVVVIGYGTQRKTDVTSAVSSVKEEEFVRGPVQDAAQLIQGKVAGLTVSNPSGDPTAGSEILLRGRTSIYGANQSPLILIDGVPGGLNTVAPEDIESIDVLKDGSAAAIYGVRGTNGVILITTKRARGNANTVDYSSSLSTQTIARQLDFLTAHDYRRQIEAGIRDPNDFQGANTDWLDEITRTPLSHIHNITFRGGSEKTNYLASVNYRSLEGIFLRSDNSTLTGRVDINHYMFDEKVRVNIGILNQENWFTQTVDGGSFSGYTYRQAIQRNPTAPIYDEEGNWHEQTGILTYENPLARIIETNGKTRRTNSRINSTISYYPVEELKLSALLSYQKFNNYAGYSETKNHISTVRDNLNGYAAIGSSETVERLVELTADYALELGNHNFSVLGGYSYQDWDNFNSWMRNYDFPTDRFSYYDIALGQALREGDGEQFSERARTNLIGFFGRLTYNYKDRYLLMANIRREGASTLFGADEPWGTFPAVSAGWKIHNEGFMSGQDVFDQLKLRVGYGVTGSQPAQGFLGVALLGYGNAVYSNGRWVQSLGPTQNPNPYIRWEEKHETNIGLDFSLFDGRISGSIDAYNRQIQDLLYDYSVPSPPNLFPTTRANVASMENKGIEAIVNVEPVRTNDFVWSSSLLFSTNRGKLINLSNDLYEATTDYFEAGATGPPIQTHTHQVRIGEDIGNFHGFKVIDISEDGEWIYEGQDGEAIAYDDFGRGYDDKKVLGNGLPKYYAGFNTNLRYKNLDLGITMRGAFDYQILNFARMYYENRNSPFYNQLKSSEDLIYGKAILNENVAQEFNSYYLEDGDFWKIDNITLGYNFSPKSKFIRSARVYASTLNTFVFTGYSGIDPEVGRTGLAPGNDGHERYPTARTFTVGINVGF